MHHLHNDNEIYKLKLHGKIFKLSECMQGDMHASYRCQNMELIKLGMLTDIDLQTEAERRIAESTNFSA